MKISCRSDGRYRLTASSRNLEVKMDAKSPLGEDSAQTPKELLGASLCGCTMMDVLALLKKHKQTFEKFEVTAAIETSHGGDPAVFTSVLLTFGVTGNVDSKILTESVHLSQTKYCGVSAMLSKAFEISYLVNLNGIEVARGKADFVKVTG